MSFVIAYRDETNGMYYIAGDSAVSIGNGGKNVLGPRTKKVFRAYNHPDILVGIVGDFRYSPLFANADLFEGLKSSENLDHMFMVKNAVPRVHELFGNCWTGESNNGANVIIVTPHALFEIQPDYSVISPSTNYTTVGIGMPYAMSSLYTSDIHPRIVSYDEYLDKCSKRIEEDITAAMKCAEKYVVGVHAPFLMLSTDGHHKILE